MRHRSARRQGFTLIELVIILSVIALLLAVGLPVRAQLRSVSGTDVSLNNLVTLSVSHILYAADWDGRQFTTARDDFGAEANNFQDYISNPTNSYFIPLGWSQHFLWVFAQSAIFYEPVVFQGPGTGVGSFRFYNFPTAFHDYVNGRTYDPIFFAPNEFCMFCHRLLQYDQH